MQTNLSEQARKLPRAEEAESILRACVHCGFCLATCPTYQLLGDERDGPRGRIYLIKAFLEGEETTRETQIHLDRCLSCRNCETTCPSGVNYHALLDIGRDAMDGQLERPLKDRWLRAGLRWALPDANRFKWLLKIGQTFRPLMPASLKEKIPVQILPAGQRPEAQHERRMLILEGCVQPGLSPNTNAATARVLNRLGVSVESLREAGCCGAMDYHLDAQKQGLDRARKNIDAWWPAIEEGAEAIIQTASGCGAFVKEYGHLLKDDPDYAEKAARVSELTRDLVEVVEKEDLQALTINQNSTLAFHCPCTLQHAQQLGGRVEAVLKKLGFSLTAVAEGHLCCGSAGTYSITQPELATQLRDHRLNALQAGQPDTIVTANIGCQTHLDAASKTPVRHWIEVVEEALQET
ncbi:glycolate oxidase subunit GlcF [Marinospirillum sp.]|uniref:glycolate oxidase subunit GlcF n=1 Tax=Marinospirillum sp. TaxID=2183934 RepID=UPI0028707E20|nr:glycolate oxidase subunit GlcF [Marinospirillum sp.]MDR9468049.1 glycolate oxidase subunit GlcF [Marinospirillum sp.]